MLDTIRAVFVIGIVALVAGLGAKVAHWQDQGEIGRLKNEVERVKGEHAIAVASAASAAYAASERYRALEARQRQRELDADHERDQERAALLAARTAADARTVRVLDQLSATTCSTPGGGTPGDPAAAADARPTSLRDILEPILSDYRQTTGDAEDLASRLREMRAKWPRDEVTPQP